MGHNPQSAISGHFYESNDSQALRMGSFFGIFSEFGHINTIRIRYGKKGGNSGSKEPPRRKTLKKTPPSLGWTLPTTRIYQHIVAETAIQPAKPPTQPGTDAFRPKIRDFKIKDA